MLTKVLIALLLILFLICIICLIIYGLKCSDFGYKFTIYDLYDCIRDYIRTIFNDTGMQCKPPNIICPMSPSLMHQNMANRKAAGESDALFTADESSSAWHCIPSNEALITCPYHDCKGSLSDPYVGCIDYSHCTEDCSGTASPIILNQCAGVAEDTSKTCDLDPNTDGTALCPSGCITRQHSLIRTCDLNPNTDSYSNLLEPDCIETATTSVANDKNLCDNVTELDNATACEAVETTAGDDGDAKACTYIPAPTPPVDTGDCPQGCNTFICEACNPECTGTATIIPATCRGTATDTHKTCDTDPLTDDTAECPDGCTETVAHTPTCDLDPNTDGTPLCPSGCESHLCPQPDIVQIQEALRRASLLQQPLRAPGAGAMEAGAMEGSQLQGPGGSQSDLAALVAGLAASTEAGISQSDLAALSAAFAPDLLAAADAQLARGVGGAAAAGAAT